MVDLDSYGAPVGRPRGVSCRSNRCPYCLVTNVWKVSLAMGHSRPSRYAVLTGVPTSDWQVNRRALARVWKQLERDEVTAGRRELLLRAWYCFEVNPKGTGFHLNLWWWGPDVPQRRLSEISEAVGWGPVAHVQRYSGRSNLRYGMKEAANYGLKELLHGAGSRVDELTPAQDAYLARNGGHLMGARRGRAAPWRDGTTDMGGSGRQLSGLAATLSAYWKSQGLGDRKSIAIDRRGMPAFSRDLESAYVPRQSEDVGKWRRAAPGRSDWSWGAWDDDTLELFPA